MHEKVDLLTPNTFHYETNLRHLSRTRQTAHGLEMHFSRLKTCKNNLAMFTKLTAHAF
jgi:hypothetical protein